MTMIMVIDRHLELTYNNLAQTHVLQLYNQLANVPKVDPLTKLGQTLGTQV